MIEYLPAVNATLNSIAFIFLVIGWRRIRRGDADGHKRMMLSAVGTSAVFLACYLTYHGIHGHTTFTGVGWRRTVYFVILATHVPLAALMVPPILLLVYFGLKGRLVAHKRLARITLPVWMYVSVTGVAVYFMLHVFWK